MGPETEGGVQSLLEIAKSHQGPEKIQQFRNALAGVDLSGSIVHESELVDPVATLNPGHTLALLCINGLSDPGRLSRARWLSNNPNPDGSVLYDQSQNPRLGIILDDDLVVEIVGNPASIVPIHAEIRGKLSVFDQSADSLDIAKDRPKIAEDILRLTQVERQIIERHPGFSDIKKYENEIDGYLKITDPYSKS